MRKRIAIIGSTGLQRRMSDHGSEEIAKGNTVLLPAFDDEPGLDAYGVAEYNRVMIEKADEVHLIWDGRSMGTVFDFGMVFAMRKPLRLVYVEEKSLRGVMEGYVTERRGGYEQSDSSDRDSGGIGDGVAAEAECR